jgi:hypothetical protein
VVHDVVLKFNALRRVLPVLPGMYDYRCILHAHAEDSTHTGGTLFELLADPKQASVGALGDAVQAFEKEELYLVELDRAMQKLAAIDPRQHDISIFASSAACRSPRYLTFWKFQGRPWKRV